MFGRVDVKHNYVVCFIHMQSLVDSLFWFEKYEKRCGHLEFKNCHMTLIFGRKHEFIIFGVKK